MIQLIKEVDDDKSESFVLINLDEFTRTPQYYHHTDAIRNINNDYWIKITNVVFLTGECTLIAEFETRKEMMEHFIEEFI